MTQRLLESFTEIKGKKSNNILYKHNLYKSERPVLKGVIFYCKKFSKLLF